MGQAILFVVVIIGIVITAAIIKDKCSINMKSINVENYVFDSEDPKVPCKYLYGDIVHEYNNVL